MIKRTKQLKCSVTNWGEEKHQLTTHLQTVRRELAATTVTPRERIITNGKSSTYLERQR
jgi:hypothetical protein